MSGNWLAINWGKEEMSPKKLALTYSHDGGHRVPRARSNSSPNAQNDLQFCHFGPLAKANHRTSQTQGIKEDSTSNGRGD